MAKSDKTFLTQQVQGASLKIRVSSFLLDDGDGEGGEISALAERMSVCFRRDAG